MVLLLLNMVLAILMDAYQAARPLRLTGASHWGPSSRQHTQRQLDCFAEVVKSKASVMVTVPQQISEMLRRRRLNREKKTDSELHRNRASCCLWPAFCRRGSGIGNQKVRLVEIWFAYLEQFQSHREMFESEAGWLRKVIRNGVMCTLVSD